MKELIKECYRFCTLRVLFPLRYRQSSRKKLKCRKVVFIESQLPELSSSMKVMYQRLEQMDDWELHVHCLQESFVSKKVYLKKAWNCLDDLGDAQYVFLCDASRLVSCITPRKETVITQLWHGCGAFKKFGMSTAELLFGGTRRQYEKYPYYKNLDYVTVSSPEVIWAYEEAMDLKDSSTVVMPIGISRTDVFFQNSFREQAKQHVIEMIPEACGKKILLYAPTFRGNVSKAKAPDALDVGMLFRELQKDYILLIKHHPVAGDRPKIPADAEHFAFDVTEMLKIEELICISDLCISDYSSLVFEYSLFERPMIFFAYDLEEYGDWRGFYYEYEELTPGPVVKTTQEIVHWVKEYENHFDNREMKAFRQRYMSACDGRATDRIIELVTERRN